MLKEKTSPYITTFQQVYVFLSLPVIVASILSDDPKIFYFSKFLSQLVLLLYLYDFAQTCESHFSFLGLLGLTFDFISEGFAVYNLEFVSELESLLSAFFFAFSWTTTSLDKFKFTRQKSYLEIILFAICSFLIMSCQHLIVLEADPKSKYWSTNSCIYCIGIMLISQLWRYKKTCSKSYRYGMIGTFIHTISVNIKFIYLGHWSNFIFEIIGLGELFSNYFLMRSIEIHVYWKMSKRFNIILQPVGLEAKKNDKSMNSVPTHIDDQLEYIFDN